MNLGTTFALALLCGTGGATAQQRAEPVQTLVERELIALMHQIDGAHQTSDVAMFGSLWADDYVLTDYRGRVKGRAQALAEWKAGEHRYTSYVSDDIRVRAYGDAAVVTARVRRASVTDPRNVGEFRHTRVFVRLQGRWRLLATQVTPILH